MCDRNEVKAQDNRNQERWTDLMSWMVEEGEKKKQINNSSESQRGTAEKVVSHLSSVFASLVQESREGTMLQRRLAAASH